MIGGDGDKERKKRIDSDNLSVLELSERMKFNRELQKKRDIAKQELLKEKMKKKMAKKEIREKKEADKAADKAAKLAKRQKKEAEKNEKRIARLDKREKKEKLIAAKVAAKAAAKAAKAAKAQAAIDARAIKQAKAAQATKTKDASDKPSASPQQKNQVQKPKISWNHKQGSPEVIGEAQRKITSVSDNIDCKFDGRTQWYQNVVSEFMTPNSSIDRLLVAHQLGTGKTRSMLEMIGNFYDDPRPIIVIVPKQSLVINFYDELFKHPTKLRSYLYRCVGKPGSEGITPALREKCIDALAKKGQIRNGIVQQDQECPDAPAAPIRCVRMTQAGSDTFAKNPILKVSEALKGSATNTYFDNCIVMIDEGHLLVKKEAWSTVQWPLIKALQEELIDAENCKLAVLTATPIVDKRQDAVDLMRIVQAKQTEKFLPGYVSWFMSRVGSVFATTNPTGVIPHIIEVEIEEGGRNWEYYRSRARQLQKKPDMDPKNGVYTAEHMGTASAGLWKRLFGPYTSKAKLKTDSLISQDWDTKNWDQSEWEKVGLNIATKLCQIAIDVKRSGLKTCVMIHKSNGLKLLAYLMNSLNVKCTFCTSGEKGEKAKDVNIRNKKNIDEFNKKENIEGNKIQCIILDSRDYSEGVSLQNVRQLILGDLGEGMKAPSWGRVKQRIGRALRFCSHASLPKDKQTLEVYLYLAKFPGNTWSLAERNKHKKAELKEYLQYELSKAKQEMVEDELPKGVIRSRLKEMKYELEDGFQPSPMPSKPFETFDTQKINDVLKQAVRVELANCELEATALDQGVYGRSGCSFIPPSIPIYDSVSDAKANLSTSSIRKPTMKEVEEYEKNQVILAKRKEEKEKMRLEQIRKEAEKLGIKPK